MTKKALVLFMIAFMFFCLLSSAVAGESLETTLNGKINLYNESVVPLADLNQTLVITVNTSKTLYNVGEEVETNGTLFLVVYNQSFPIPGQLIALQINDRAGNFAYRTLETAPGVSPQQWQINVSRAYIGDSAGNPFASVTKGQLVYTWLTYNNDWNQLLHVMAAYTVVDANNVRLYSLAPVEWDLQPGQNVTIRSAWSVPSYAASGSAKLIASAFSGPPSSGGFPYCPERSSSFTVASSAYSASTSSQVLDTLIQQNGTYVTYAELSKKVDVSIPSGTRIGNYTVYVSAKYGDQLRANATTTFQVRLLGDVDGVQNPSSGTYSVNILDAIKIAQAFGSQLGSPNWNPKADFNGDNRVNILDAIILSANFGNYAL